MATPFCPADIFDFPLRAVDLYDIPRKGQEAGATREKVVLRFEDKITQKNTHGKIIPQNCLS